MKSLLAIMMTFPISNFVVAQTTLSQVIASTGRSASAGSVQVDYTLGEVAITTLQSPANKLTQGFHQPTDISVGISQQPNWLLQLEAYPNPTENRLTLSITASAPALFSAITYDVTGRNTGLLLRGETNEKYVGNIDVSQLSAGAYFIQLTDANGKHAGTLRFQKL